MESIHLGRWRRRGDCNLMSFSRRRFMEAALALAATGIGAPASAQTKTQWLDAVGMATAIRKRKSRARSFVTTAIARAERANPQLNVFGYQDFETARALSRRVKTKSAFVGVPTLIKGNHGQIGLPLTEGSRALADVIATETSPFVEAMSQSGLISIGRTTLPEFGLMPVTEPLLTRATRNPYALAYTPGGSSGGSAAAVAAGIVPIAHANDGGGSIRIPASNCGLIGLKPSRGRMIAANRAASVQNLGVQGCLTRTMRDTAAFFAALEDQSADAPLPPVGLVAQALDRPLKIGLWTARVDGSDPHPDVMKAVESTAEVLRRLGHDVRPTQLPFDFRHVADAFLTLWGLGAAKAYAEVEQKLGRAPTEDDLEPATLMFAQRGAQTPPEAQRAAIGVLENMARAYQSQFDSIDLLMTPTLAEPPVEIGWLDSRRPFDTLLARLEAYASYTPLENASGSPAISLPLGYSAFGLPIGVQFAAKLGNERLLLELGFQLEQIYRFADIKPGLWVGDL